MIKLATKYALFAGISIAGNLLVQRLCFFVYETGVITLFIEYTIYIALFFGTGVGLVIKYILDKFFIFYYQVESKKEDFIKFMLYTLMGVFTTVIFWGTELAFNYFFTFDSAKYIGGFIGLVIGYTTKYFLDKNFVFVKKV